MSRANNIVPIIALGIIILNDFDKNIYNRKPPINVKIAVLVPD